MSETSKEILQELLHPTRKAMDKHGMTVDHLIKKGKKLLEAEKTVFQKIKGDVPDNSTAVIAINAEIVAETDSEAVIAINVDDLAIQQKQEDMFYKLGGHYPSEKVDHTVNIGMELSKEEAEMAKRAVDYVLKHTLLGDNDEK